MDEPGLVEQQMEPRIPVNETGVQRWGWMPLLWVQRKFDILIFETDRSVFKPRSKTSISSWWLNNSVGVWHWSSMPNLSSNFYHVLVIVQSSLTFVVGAWFPYCFLSYVFSLRNNFWYQFLAMNFNIKHWLNWWVIMILTSCFENAIDRFSTQNLLWTQRSFIQPQRCMLVSFAFWRRTREQDDNLCPAERMALCWIESQIAITDYGPFLRRAVRGTHMPDIQLERQHWVGRQLHSLFGVQLKHACFDGVSTVYTSKQVVVLIYNNNLYFNKNTRTPILNRQTFKALST